MLRGADETAPTAPPASGLTLLGELTARARAAGLDVRTRVTGTPATALPLAERAAAPWTPAPLVPAPAVVTPLLVAVRAWVRYTFRGSVTGPSYL
ncbi:hypothetical protein SNE510_55780 [Streptomyces sp. NE5-10]|uniref:hypothetical protein n=1 Tax=Streptomyces sp. NE5-10 TaxID=2759674 RepID=UPI001A4D6C23|nr:hypothetical protein [Streptomyces sp. NE5-10]GHJ96059.1 hypothetical protein SNE510_55780 [Streptomyces sp. NE5-10]